MKLSFMRYKQKTIGNYIGTYEQKSIFTTWQIETYKHIDKKRHFTLLKIQSQTQNLKRSHQTLSNAFSVSFGVTSNK